MKIFKISSLFKFIYVGVIFIFLFIFYTNKEIYKYNINGLLVTEISSLERPLLPKKIKSLDIQYKGLSFYISKTSPISITTNDNVIRNSNIESIHIEKNSVILNIENSVILNIRVDNNGNRLTINTTIPKVFPIIKELTIPYTLRNNHIIEQSELSYKISSSTEEFHLKINDQYYIDDIKKKIHLSANEDKISTLTFSPLSGSDLPIAEQWYMKHKDRNIEPINDIIENYLSKVEKGINKTFSAIRYNKSDKLWYNLPSSKLYTEKSAIIYLAMGMKQGNYSAKIKKISELKNRNPQNFGYSSTPYLGAIVINGKEGSDENRKILAETKNIIKSSGIKLFETWISEHYFEGNNIDLKLLEKAMNNVDRDSLALEGLGIYLNNLLHIINSGIVSSNISDSIKDISDRIIQKIYWDETDIYLINDNNISFMELNLKIGKLLIETSQHESSEYSKPIGEGLISTYLNSSNKTGAIKKSYNATTKKFSTDTLRPEESYLEFSDNPYLPHYYQDHGISIWTISDSIEITQNINSTKISISYPMDRNSTVNSHFLTMSGIKPYNKLFFRGKPWRADKSFEKWGIGYYYDSKSQLLYFMPNHTKSREEIVITY